MKIINNNYKIYKKLKIWLKKRISNYNKKIKFLKIQWVIWVKNEKIKRTRVDKLINN